MNAKTVIENILKDKGEIKQVYWVACGGSLIDLYPAHCLLMAESAKVESGWYNSREFMLSTPKKLGANSLVIACSHSGNTPEAVDAAVMAHEKGAAVVSLTDGAGSKMDDERLGPWVYPWGDEVPVAQVPSGITLQLAAELVQQQEGFAKYDALLEGIGKMDGIIKAAVTKVNEGETQRFADMCGENPFFYILGSGSTFSQTYGFAICSMMEMQWQHCSYIHSGEYFHGPFEVTTKDVFYYLQMGSGVCRPMDERALAFLQTHTDKLMVVDALALGMDAVELSVRDYLDPILFYAMNVTYRAKRGEKFDHPVETRRYMGIEQY